MRLWQDTLNDRSRHPPRQPPLRVRRESRTSVHAVAARRARSEDWQYEIRDSAGQLLARLDFAWPELGVFLEFDGKEKYLKHRPTRREPS